MKYKIFILDDKQENIDAAVSALSEFADEIKTAKNYEEGTEVLKTFEADIAFIDMNFPRSAGGEDEKLGEEFRKEFLQAKNIPHAIVTGGIDHGDAIVKIMPAWYLPFGKINPNQVSYRDACYSRVPSKTTPIPWKEAWKHTAEQIEEDLSITKLGGFEWYVNVLRKFRSEM
jgi:CheY-like chemotaxis protein